MLHSIGCPQPSAEVLIKSWNGASAGTCVHAFIDGNSGDVYQTLPWNYRGWHCGSGTNGSGNNTHIAVEMCEPACIKYTSGANFICSDMAAARTVAEKTYKAAVELFAMLCKKYSINPLADGIILSHREGHTKGIASNHGDPEHLWTQLGMEYTMDGFRRAVKMAMDGGNVSVFQNTDERKIWDKLKSFGLNDYAVAGIMGNLFAESSLKSNNLQNTFNVSLGMTDEEYTDAVDNGRYSNFVYDKAGYGLAQWTFWSRKQALMEYAQKTGRSIGNPQMQLEFFWQEIQGYKAVMDVLKSTVFVLEASNAVLHGYEQPADQSEAVENKRAVYGQAYYDKYAIQTIPVKTGWVQEDGGWRYYLSPTICVTNDWYKDGNNWYYFDIAGMMAADKWQQYKEGWYYLGTDGAMLTGLWEIGGKWYYFDQNGRMATEPVLLTPDKDGALQYPGLVK